jgi:hypothetical protein
MARTPKITPRMLSNARRQASRTTAKNIESKTGPIQKAGRAVDNFGRTVAKNYRAADAAADAASKKVGKVVGKIATRYKQGDFRPEAKLAKSGAKAAVKGEGNIMAKAGKYLTDGLATKKATQKAVGRAAVYGSAAAMGGAYALGRSSGGSSWSDQKKKSSGSGWQKPSPYGL